MEAGSKPTCDDGWNSCSWQQISSPELDVFLGQQKKMQTSDGLPVMVIDFTTLGRGQELAEESMLVAIITGENQTLFVKMDGARIMLEKNRDDFY